MSLAELEYDDEVDPLAPKMSLPAVTSLEGLVSDSTVVEEDDEPGPDEVLVSVLT